jgi:hypothetical protein
MERDVVPNANLARLWRLDPRDHARLRLAVVAALALAAGFLTWLGVRGEDDSPAAAPAVTAPTGVPQETSPADLAALAAGLGHPVYWLGPRSNATYEATQTSDGNLFVRYLPNGVDVGDKRLYRTVGTYPVRDAYGAVQAVAAKPGGKRFSAPGGGLAAVDPAHATSVYVAYPGSPVEIEVFDPAPGAARRLVTSGRLVAVG